MTINGSSLSDSAFVFDICCYSSFVEHLDMSSRQNRSLPACWALCGLSSLVGELFCLDLVSFSLSLTFLSFKRPVLG